MGLGSWINRKRHNRGFGIQSPSAFFFVTQVLKERRAYYAYTQLDKAIKGNSNYAREIFRITNYLQPTNCISVGSADAACAILLAKPSVQHHAFLNTSELKADAGTLLNTNGCHIIDNIEQFGTVIKELGTIGMLYINATDSTMPLVRAALPHTDAKSMIMVAGIHRNKRMREWWQQLVNDSATVVTYDMYSYGLLFFDKERRKQHYTLKR